MYDARYANRCGKMTKAQKMTIRGWIWQGARFRRDASGTAAIEFAFLAPVLFMLLIGMFQFGIMINNYIQVTEAVRVGGRTLAISRGATTPFTSARDAIYNSAPGLTQGNFTITMTVNGTACSADAACKTTMSTAQGTQATVTAAYACTNLIVYGTNFMPGCSLSSTTSGRVE